MVMTTYIYIVKKKALLIVSMHKFEFIDEYLRFK